MPEARPPTILPIRLYGDPVLKKKASTVTDFGPIPQLAADMLETMYAANGVGLAAPQIGLSKRVFVAVEYSDDEAEGEEAKSTVLNEYVMVNPKITLLDQERVTGVEGCLSIPEIFEDGVARARRLRVSYQDQYGKHQVLESEDYLARIIQHEFDHLEGRLFLQLLPPAILAKHRDALVGMQGKAKSYLKSLQAG
jgi:peptide deformylase